MFGDISGCHNWRGMLWTPNEQRPRMMLNILQCTGQPPTTKSYRLQKVNSAKEPCVSITAGHSAGQRTRGRDEVAQDEAG